MNMKICFKCYKEKNLDQFYKHPNMADGHLGKCKDCTRHDIEKHRSENLERIREYDRNRPNKAHRNFKNLARQKTENGKLIHKKALANYDIKHPEKRRAVRAAGNAIRDGKLKRLPCIKCGKNGEAHHEDYSKPLDVIFYCNEHHRARHREINEERRKQIKLSV